MVVIRTNKGPFVYGQIFFAPKKSTFRPPPGYERVAVEILREFSSTEFVGRLYTNVGTWIPATWTSLNQYNWYQHYERAKGGPMAEMIQFAMEGSAIWKVEFLRDESDEFGPYVAIGLKLK
jgi:hypothetical protein